MQCPNRNEPQIQKLLLLTARLNFSCSLRYQRWKYMYMYKLGSKTPNIHEIYASCVALLLIATLCTATLTVATSKVSCMDMQRTNTKSPAFALRPCMPRHRKVRHARYSVFVPRVSLKAQSTWPGTHIMKFVAGPVCIWFCSPQQISIASKPNTASLGRYMM